MTKEQEVLKDLKEVTLEELDEAIKAVDKQEQEGAIEKIKKLDYLLDDVYSTGLVENEERNQYQYAIETVLSMLKEKDKQIDLMANHIATSDSDLCEYLDITTKCKYYAGDNKKTCDNCIRQYFENKAKELLNK